MNNQNPVDEKSKQWQSWLILFLRWLLGGLAGIGLSAWIYYGLKNDSFNWPHLYPLFRCEFFYACD